MKRFLFAVVCSCLSCMAMFAQTYTEPILVKVNGNPAPESTNTIEVTKHDDGTCDFLLRNFVLKAEPDSAFPNVDMSNPVGNINLKNVKMVDKGGHYEISTEQTIQIEAGDDSTVESWMGPQLPPVPIVLNGTMDKEHINASIQIDLMVMKIDVTIGKAETDNGKVSYTEPILVKVNGNLAPESTNTIEVTKHEDGTCDFLLRNFVLKAEPDPSFPDVDMSNPVGNINLKNVKMVDKGGYYEISTEQTIQIEAGDDSNVESWMGPGLPPVPIVLNGTMDKEHINASIQIDLMVMKIDVTIGKANPETGIQNVTVNSAFKNSGVYNLNGIRVAEGLDSSIPAGAYIIDGKKVIVK